MPIAVPLRREQDEAITTLQHLVAGQPVTAGWYEGKVQLDGVQGRDVVRVVFQGGFDLEVSTRRFPGLQRILDGSKLRLRLSKHGSVVEALPL